LYEPGLERDAPSEKPGFSCQYRTTKQTFRNVLAGSIVEDEETIPMPDGTVRSLWYTMIPVLDEKREVISITATYRDITERKRMEE